MTTPICAHVRKAFETMWDAVIELRLVGIGLCIGLRDALGNDFSVALLVTSILAIRALHACRVPQKPTAQSTAHDAVELLLNEFVTVLLVDVLFPLTNGALSTKADIDELAVSGLLGCYMLAEVCFAT